MRKLLIKILGCSLLLSLGACGATNQPAQDNPATASQPHAKKSWLPAKIPAVIDNSVFFPLNSYQVATTYNNIIKYNADYLVAHPKARLLLHAYTTETKNPISNAKLGQERISSVRKALLQSGVTSEQIETKLSQDVHPDNKNNVITKNQRIDLIYINEAPSFYSYSIKPTIEMP